MPPDVDEIRNTARGILRCIRDACEGVADTFGDDFHPLDTSQTPHPGKLRVISALAAGSDQWLAEEALELTYELQCPLPFSRDEYRKDFVGDEESQRTYDALLQRATAVLELDGIVETDADGVRWPDSRSYEALGRLLLDQSDIIIALWDGQSSRGRGGTAQVVSEALQRGIPVVRISWEQASEWELHEPPWRLLQSADDQKGDFDRLSEQVVELLKRPKHSGEHKNEPDDLWEAYFKREHHKSGNALLGWWTVFRDVLTGDVLRFNKFGQWLTLTPFRVEEFTATAEAEWEDAWKPLSQSRPAVAEHIKRSFLNHYAWANGLSIYYANLYRSSFVLNYMLGALAVLFALLGEVVHLEKPVWTSIELLLIVTIVGITVWGWYRRWHEKWIDYRTLAERLRMAQYLALFGGGGQQVSLPEHLASYGNPAATWMHWHYRAVERAAGMPNARFDAAYLELCQNLWCKSLVQKQKLYHSDNERRFHNLDHRLHFLGTILFLATFVVCAIHFFSDHGAPHTWTFGLLTLLAAALPAFGAAFAAIRSQGEFQRVSRRSGAMHERLTELSLDMATVSTAGGKLNSVHLRKDAEQVTNLLINEMLDWRIVFQDRPLALPA
jgi:hypothetical protein